MAAQSQAQHPARLPSHNTIRAKWIRHGVKPNAAKEKRHDCSSKVAVG